MKNAKKTEMMMSTKMMITQPSPHKQKKQATTRNTSRVRIVRSPGAASGSGAGLWGWVRPVVRFWNSGPRAQSLELVGRRVCDTEGAYGHNRRTNSQTRSVFDELKFERLVPFFDPLTQPRPGPRQVWPARPKGSPG